MTTFIANFVFPASATIAARPRAGLARRLLDRLVALDAGHRAAHRLAHATDVRLVDVGLTRAQAKTEFARHTGRVDTPAQWSQSW